MALVKIKIFGRELNDTISIKLMVGILCIGLLLVFMGVNNFYDWTVDSLGTYVATIMLILAVTNIFVKESVESWDLALIIIGITVMVVVCAKTYNSLMETGISIIKTFIWVTIFSILLEVGQKHMQKMGKKVLGVVETKGSGLERKKLYEKEWIEEDNIITVRDLPGKRQVQRQPYVGQLAAKKRNQ